MPKQKLIATRKMMYNTRHLQAGDPFEANSIDAMVLTKLRKTARPDYNAPVKETLVAQQPEVPATAVAEPAAAVDVDALRAEAEAAGIRVDRRWGEARLRDEIAFLAKQTAAKPEPEPVTRPPPVMTTTSYYTPPPSGGDSVHGGGGGASVTVTGGAGSGAVNVGSTAHPVYRRNDNE